MIYRIGKYLTTAFLLLMTQWVSSDETRPLKVAFIYQHSVGAGGWTQSHEQARVRAQQHFGSRVKTTAFEGIEPGPDTVRVLTKLARDEYDMIFATAFGHMNPIARVARQFPRVAFEHASGYKRAKNLGTYQIRATEGRYLAGIIAGHMTKSGRIGYVASYPIPEVIRGINAFALGIQSVRDDAQVEVIWINAWLDASLEREAAELLIGRKADVLSHHTESPAILIAAEASGVYGIGYQYDRSAFAPTAHLVTVEHNWEPIVIDKIDAKLNATWRSEDTWAGIREDATRLVGLSDQIPRHVLEYVGEVKQEIANDQVRVFTGPIRDTDGNVRIAASKSLTADKTLDMEWFVAGVKQSR